MVVKCCCVPILIIMSLPSPTSPPPNLSRHIHDRGTGHRASVHYGRQNTTKEFKICFWVSYVLKKMILIISSCLTHTCDIFLEPDREIWDFSEGDWGLR